jgi:hypothetical protein
MRTLNKGVKREQELTKLNNNLSSIREMLSNSGYGEKAIEDYLDKSNQGPPKDADQVSEVTGTCRDSMKSYLESTRGTS